MSNKFKIYQKILGKDQTCFLPSKNLETDSSGIYIGKLSKEILFELRNIVDELIPTDEVNFNLMEIDEYRSIQLKVQNNIISAGYPSKIFKSAQGQIEDYFGSSKLLIKSNLQFRASRSISPKQECIGWHRESFYGSGQYSVNMWIPIRGVTKENTLRYIPESHLLDNKNIKICIEDDSITKRFSTGHKLGFLYKNKIILDGIDFTKAKPLPPEIGQFALFPGELVHGSAINNTQKIRISIDFSIIRKKDWDKTFQKKSHFASGGKPLFIEIE